MTQVAKEFGTFNRTIIELKQNKFQVPHHIRALPFNRTIIELKPWVVLNDGCVAAAFNRTIIELKLRLLFDSECRRIPFNRTIIELKPYSKYGAISLTNDF